jgi:hypothetical protein
MASTQSVPGVRSSHRANDARDPTRGLQTRGTSSDLAMVRGRVRAVSLVTVPRRGRLFATMLCGTVVADEVPSAVGGGNCSCANTGDVPGAGRDGEVAGSGRVGWRWSCYPGCCTGARCSRSSYLTPSADNPEKVGSVLFLVTADGAPNIPSIPGARRLGTSGH